MLSAELLNIKSKAHPNTLRKGAITSDQLKRRYAVLQPSDSKRPAPNLLDITRWFSKQKEEVQSILDKEESLTWLKHLLDKRPPESPRVPWHLTALIMEEYEKSKAQSDGMETIPEGVAVDSVRTKASPPSSNGQQAGNRSPSTDSWAWTSPRHSLDPSLSRRRATGDGPISFEPLVDSGRDSIGDVKSIGDLPSKAWTHISPDGANSPRSSIHSGILNTNWTQGLSSNSRLQFREFAHRIRRKPYAASEEALSSARNSMSEQSLDEEGPLSRPGPHSRPKPIRAHSPSTLVSDEDRKRPRNPPEIVDTVLSSGGEGPATAKQGVSPYSSPPHPPSQPKYLEPKTPGLLTARLSTPNLSEKRSRASSPVPLSSKERGRQRQQEDEERERREYEHKAQ